MTPRVFSIILRGLVAGVILVASVTVATQLYQRRWTTAQDETNEIALGIGAQYRGNYQSAIIHFQEAHRLFPQRIVPLFDAGDAEQFAGDLVAASSYYRQCLRLDPQYIPALYNLAVSNHQRHPLTAINLYQRVIRQTNYAAPYKTLIAESHVNLGLLLEQRGQSRSGEAQIAIGLRLDPFLAAQLPGPSS